MSEETVAKLYAFREWDKLDVEVVDCLINCVLIHSDKDIEIAWNDCIG